eukprot:m.56045 g.56045  ORF g.56045 m.56045 type:complete len:307 (+) comp12574_c0_seq1:248-1168(+)
MLRNGSRYERDQPTAHYATPTKTSARKQTVTYEERRAMAEQRRSATPSRRSPLSNGYAVDQDGWQYSQPQRQPAYAAIVEKLTDTRFYTGSHKARVGEGGRELGQAGRVDERETTKDFSQLMDRSPADVRGRKVDFTHVGMPPRSAEVAVALSPASPTRKLLETEALLTPSPSPARNHPHHRQQTKSPGQRLPRKTFVAELNDPNIDLLGVFEEYCLFGAGMADPNDKEVVQKMDGTRFYKLCRECHLLSRKLTRTDVDLIFTKVKPRGGRRIDFATFCDALDHIAAHKAVPTQAIERKILSACRP